MRVIASRFILVGSGSRSWISVPRRTGPLNSARLSNVFCLTRTESAFYAGIISLFYTAARVDDVLAPTRIHPNNSHPALLSKLCEGSHNLRFCRWFI